MENPRYCCVGKTAECSNRSKFADWTRSGGAKLHLTLSSKVGVFVKTRTKSTYYVNFAIHAQQYLRMAFTSSAEAFCGDAFISRGLLNVHI